MFLSSFLMLNILCSVYGDIRVPVLTAPLASFNSPSLKAFYVDTNPEYYGKVTTYDVWQTPRGNTITAFEVIAESSIAIMFADASILLGRSQLSVATLNDRGFYDCPDDCYFVKDADILAVTRLGLTAANLSEVQLYTVLEMHEFAVAAMEQKFCFNMTALEQKLGLSSLRVINDQWPLFSPDMVAASVKCRADQLNVTVDELAELLNANTSTFLGYDINQAENIFFPAFDDCVARKNLFETQELKIATAGMTTADWQSHTMAYFANHISKFSVRHLEILYRWASAQLFAIERIPLSTYFSQCNTLTTNDSAFDLSQIIFGHQTSLPTCNVAFVLSRSLGEDETRFNLANIRNRNILTVFRNASGISSWFDFYHPLFAISEGIWMETPLVSQLQGIKGFNSSQILTYSVPQIAYEIRSLNASGALSAIMKANYQQYLPLLMQTYGFTKSSLASITGRTEAQIDRMTIQEAHDLIFQALFLRYDIIEFLGKLNVSGVHNYVAINLPSFEWDRLVRAVIVSSFEQLATAFSVNLTAGTGGILVTRLADSSFSIRTETWSSSSTFVISSSRLATCLGTTEEEVYGRTMPGYQSLYQGPAVDLMNKKIILETTDFNSLLNQLGITFGSINTEIVGQTIQNRVGLSVEELRCVYGWSSEFTNFLFSLTWDSVSSSRLCHNYTSWPLQRIIVALMHSTHTECRK